MPYEIVFARETREHLEWLSARQRAIVLNAVAEQLAHQPSVETRNRKPLRPNELADWELRVGRLRVYYDVSDQPEPVVRVKAVGIKEREQVWIGGKVVRL